MPDDRDARDDAARAADHAGIDRLVNALVPALMAKLATLNVGELEVREGDWRVRLRRPAGAGPSHGRRATDRPSRAHPGHEQHGHPAAAPEPHRPPRAAHAAGTVASTNGSGGPSLAPVGPGRSTDPASPAATPDPAAAAATAGRSRIATSPAVGVFQPGPKAVGGTRVRAGDRLGAVDMLGVPQEVVSPVDGIVVGVIVEAGTAVEYGQELINLEPAVPAEGR
ncbi:MAG TPA: biotin/lipoyl-containing protein [Candidatus Sulfomarinibacteraceae bacterium]|nr:biotin/lipoyl-containing protein [Candidatus Sulfomarinibacteraceae bacterium]